MPRPATRNVRTRLRHALIAATAGVITTAGVAVVAAGGPADAGTASGVSRSGNVVTPGDFTGYGFDQCLAPDQTKMNRWLQSSPFLAVGIYISGNSRACRSQPNLTATWVSRQLAAGWRLLPITLGPQASCQPRFPRYGDDPTIIPKPGTDGRYGQARTQGTNEASKTVGVATKLGIVAGSTLWYDLEGFDLTNTNCRESALAFLSAWTTRLHKLGYVSGVYSSAGSGIKMLDDARVTRPDQVVLPDQLWVARWDGAANTTTSYLRSDGWMPHARIKQYQGGHNETWGGVTINIDRNYLDVGRGMVAGRETHCGGVRVGLPTYETLRAPTATVAPPPKRVRALQCLLTEKGSYRGPVDGRWSDTTVAAFQAWQAGHGMATSAVWSRANWMSLLSAGDRPVLKIGSTGTAVRRLQRTLNAAGPASPVRIDGLFGTDTSNALRAWQRKVRVEASGVAGRQTWKALATGRA